MSTDIRLRLDPELAKTLPEDPQKWPSGLQPGVPLPKHLREQALASVGVLGKYYGERLPSESDYTVADDMIPVEGGVIDIRVVKPTTTGGHPGTYPAFVWFAGGGWVFGNLEQDDNHLRTISVDLQVVVINVGYRNAPEHVFPTPFDDCYASLKWVVENATALQVSLSKGFVVGGDSAGGNLCAAVTLKARDDPFFSGNPLTGQYLRQPAVIHPSAHSSSKYASELKSFTEMTDPRLILYKETGSTLFEMYAAPPMDVRMSPLLAPSHAGLPPAYIHVMEVDPLRDDGIVYERVLREAGVKTQIIKHAGAMHGFYYTFPDIPLALEVDRCEREGLRWLLSFSKTS